MKATVQKTMRAVAIDHFGGIDALSVQTVLVPEVGPGEILIRIESAGVGVWDPFEIQGGFAEKLGVEPEFPYIPGCEGAGTVARVGDEVGRFKEGDRVYAASLLNPKGGFYAEYAVVASDHVSHLPEGLSVEQAGVMAVDAITGLQGLEDVLELKPGESLMIFGAGGGIGHMAVQLAQRMSARVFAVVSGDDGVGLVARYEPEVVIDGRKEDIVAAAREFAPDGLDAALLTAGGGAAQQAFAAIRRGGQAAYPNGVRPVPETPEGVSIEGYDGTYDRESIRKLNALIDQGPFEVHVARSFSLDQVVEAHRALETHYLGKLALKPA